MKISKLILYILFILLISNISAQNDTESKICQKLYYLHISGKDIQNLSDSDLSNLRNQLNLNISDNLIQNYGNNYSDLCYLKGYSDILPIQQPKLIVIDKSEENESCQLNSSPFNDYYIALPETNLGNLSCSSTNNFNKMFRLAYFNGNTSIVGINLMTFTVILLLIGILILYISERKLKKILK